MSQSAFRNMLSFAQSMTHGGARDLYKVFGFTRILTVDNYYSYYRRDPIAKRIIITYPQSTWADTPLIYDDEGQREESSGFAKLVCDFMEENSVYSHLERVDRLSGIGKFAVLIMGFQDGGSLNEPLKDGQAKLLYLDPYDQREVRIESFETDSSNPRFNLPLTYMITPKPDEEESSNQQRSGFKVHHSRVLHVAEFLNNNEIYGMPRLESVFNDIQSLEKVAHGSPEIFWLNGRGGMGLWADKAAQLTEPQKEAMKQQAIDYAHELSRIMVGSGMEMQPFNLPVPDPKPSCEVLLDRISAGTGIPKRILLGSERAELSSNQDENNFQSRVSERQINFAIPKILKPFIQKMIETGNLPQPKGRFYIEWDDSEKLSESDQAEISTKRTNALVQYSNSPNASLIVPEGEFRSEFLNLPSEIPDDFINDVIDELEESEEEQLEFDAIKSRV